MSGTWENSTVYLVDGRQVFVSNNYPNLNYTIIKVKSNTKKKEKQIKSKQDFNESKKQNKSKKRVTFNNIVNINNTYSDDEYDRSPIDSIIYLRTLQRINGDEWKDIFSELNQYKLQEMQVHKDSIQNVKIHNFST